jgi:hypothetical protein
MVISLRRPVLKLAVLVAAASILEEVPQIPNVVLMKRISPKQLNS